MCDFGISRMQASMMTTGAGSIQYMAPEVFVSAHYTEKSDIYSFAIVLWELLSRETPYDKLSQFESWDGSDSAAARVPTEFMVMSEVKNGKRLLVPQNAPPGYAALIADCWAHQDHQRPGFPEILRRLREMEHEYPLDGMEGKMMHVLTRPASSSLRDQMSVLQPPARSPVEHQTTTGFTPARVDKRGGVSSPQEPSLSPRRTASSSRMTKFAEEAEARQSMTSRNSDFRNSEISLRSGESSELEFEREQSANRSPDGAQGSNSRRRSSLSNSFTGIVEEAEEIESAGLLAQASKQRAAAEDRV